MTGELERRIKQSRFAQWETVTVEVQSPYGTRKQDLYEWIAEARRAFPILEGHSGYDEHQLCAKYQTWATDVLTWFVEWLGGEEHRDDAP